MHMLKRSLSGLSLLFLCAGVALAAEEGSVKSLPLVTFESGDKQVSLLELFTSEGCSSCPPADQWVSKLKDDEKLWKDVVPLVFHVDYWDKLGWKDKFASKEFTERHNAYARRWRSNSVYTPAVVVNATEWNGWSKSLGFPVTGKLTGQLKVSKAGPHDFIVTFSPADASNRQWLAHGALLGFDIRSKVEEGENQGKVLYHDFVALKYTNKRMEVLGEKFRVKLSLPPTRIKAKNYGIAVWITKADDILPVQATGGPLPAAS